MDSTDERAPSITNKEKSPYFVKSNVDSAVAMKEGEVDQFLEADEDEAPLHNANNRSYVT